MGVVYVESVAGTGFEQGEIISDLVSYAPVCPRAPEDDPSFSIAQYQFAIILTQSCDLVQRATGPDLERNVLLCEVQLESSALPQIQSLGRALLDNLKQNRNHRYQFLSEISPADDLSNEGSGEPLYVDFRKIFTLPLGELLFQISENARRRCKLATVYREHLASRYGYFLSRVALEVDHHNVAKVARALPAPTP